MRRVALAFDTSNYTTSAAYYDAAEGRLHNCGRLLTVEKGGRGLRQSDAVFAHIKNLPEVVRELFPGGAGDIEAVGVSERPRAAEGSYMPCFLAGVASAETLSAASGRPLYRFSHQQGHIAAAAYGAGKPGLLASEFLVWHLSGGTTELLRAVPDNETIVKAELVAATGDLSAGQVTDRAGVKLGLGFPAGRELDALAQRCVSP